MGNILVTGGAGYIGSHTTIELLKVGHDVVVVDNLSNSHPGAIGRIELLAGRSFTFYQSDILDLDAIRTIFTNHSIDAVIHFAGFKAVGESVEKPLEYYSNNVGGTLSLCQAMREHGVKKIIFSSSCTVYGEAEQVPISESSPTGRATNPYGRSKVIIEQILEDLHRADGSFDVTLLRYFNPAGAHPSGELGEDPRGIPNNLFPYITQVAIGRLQRLSVFGDDYPTPDGTGVRDYIHVVDLALGHLKALEYHPAKPSVRAYNLGTGKGYSVLDIIKAFERVNACEIPYEIVARRSGDVAKAYSDPSKAARELGWKAERGLEDMCRDAWNWQQKYPNGLMEG